MRQEDFAAGHSTRCGRQGRPAAVGSRSAGCSQSRQAARAAGDPASCGQTGRSPAAAPRADQQQGTAGCCRSERQAGAVPSRLRHRLPSRSLDTRAYRHAVAGRQARDRSCQDRPDGARSQDAAGQYAAPHEAGTGSQDPAATCRKGSRGPSGQNASACCQASATRYSGRETGERKAASAEQGQEEGRKERRQKARITATSRFFRRNKKPHPAIELDRMGRSF
jgi:hypothetical protein